MCKTWSRIEKSTNYTRISCLCTFLSMFSFLLFFYVKTGFANKFCSFVFWSKWYPGIQNNENLKSFKTFKSHGSNAGHEGTL